MIKKILENFLEGYNEGGNDVQTGNGDKTDDSNQNEDNLSSNTRRKYRTVVTKSGKKFRIRKTESRLKGVQGQITDGWPEPPTPPDVGNWNSGLVPGDAIRDSSAEFFDRPLNQIADHSPNTIAQEAKTSRGLSTTGVGILAGIGLFVKMNEKSKLEEAEEEFEKDISKWARTSYLSIKLAEIPERYSSNSIKWTRSETPWGKDRFTNSPSQANFNFSFYDAVREAKGVEDFRHEWDSNEIAEFFRAGKIETKELIEYLSFEEGDTILCDLIISESEEGELFIREVENIRIISDEYDDDLIDSWTSPAEREREFLIKLPADPDKELQQYLEEGWISVEEYNQATDRIK